MIMTFYIEGRPEGSTSFPADIGYYEAFSLWAQEKAAHLPELSLNETTTWIRDGAKNFWERSKQTFRYLNGAPMSKPPLPNPGDQDKQTKSHEGQKRWNFAGMFSSLKGTRRGSDSSTSSRIESRTFTEGEVHADLVRVSTTPGWYALLMLITI